MIVDTHVHPVSDDLTRYPFAVGADRGPDWYSGTHFTAEECIVQMDRAGVDQMVLVNSYSAYGYDNSYAAAAAAQYPARFVSVCRLDPLAPAETLRSWIEERGMRGARLGTADARAYPTCEQAQQLGIPVSLQVSRRDLGLVRDLASRFPDLSVILDHLSHPFLEDGPPYTAASELFALADYPNVFPKFSSMNFRESSAGKSTPQTFFEALVARFGPDRLLWGSDFPHTKGGPTDPYKELVDLARTSLAFLAPADREQMFGGTARRLFPALADANP